MVKWLQRYDLTLNKSTFMMLEFGDDVFYDAYVKSRILYGVLIDGFTSDRIFDRNFEGTEKNY